MASVFRIKGGRPLEGKVEIGGAKNSALELISAALLTGEEVVLRGVPRLSDVETISELLRTLGASVAWQGSGTLRIYARRLSSVRADAEIVGKMRASVYVLGSLLAREGRAEVAAPGGCAIGARPINVHLKAFEALGAKIIEEGGYIIARAPEGGLRGAAIDCKVKIREEDGVVISTHGGSVNAVEAASLARGHTTILHASNEPEVDDLIAMINLMGGKIIRDRAKGSIEIDGAEVLHGLEYDVMPDRLEAGTYAVLAAATRSRLVLAGADPTKMRATLDKLREIGAKIGYDSESDELSVDARGVALKAADIEVAQYPGFPTDMQSQFAALLSVADGVAHIRETLFENRLMYAPELAKMGAKIEAKGDIAVITGVGALHGADVSASDMRAGAALVIASLGAEGESVVRGVGHIKRGYQQFAENLRAIGADIKEEAE